MDGGAWWAAVHGVARSRIRLNDFTFAFHFHALEKEMATHSSILAWRLPGTEEPVGLPSLEGLDHRAGRRREEHRRRRRPARGPDDRREDRIRLHRQRRPPPDRKSHV